MNTFTYPYYYNLCQSHSLYGSQLYLLVLSPNGLSIKCYDQDIDWKFTVLMQISLAVYSKKAIDSLVNKESPPLSTAAKRNVFKVNLHFYSKGEKLCHTIHSLKFLGPKPQPYRSSLLEVSIRGAIPCLPKSNPSPPVWGEVDRGGQRRLYA